MAFSATHYVCLILVLFSAVRGSEGQCTQQELTAIFTCIIPHNQEFFDAIGVSDSTCNRSRITTSICQTFGQIVTCIQGKNLSNDTCIPHAAGQINPQMEIPCKVEDFFFVCTDVPNIWGITTVSLSSESTPTTLPPTDNNGTTTTTTTTTTKNGNGSNGAAAHVVWMTSLLTSLMTLKMAADRR